jgi:hypothetical protein
MDNHRAPAASSMADSTGGITLAQGETSTKEKHDPASQLDPYTASATFRWDAQRDKSDQLGFCWIRSYYWYDPDHLRPTVYDCRMRAKHPEIGDDEWRELFRQAFLRGEADVTRNRGEEAQRALLEYELLVPLDEDPEGPHE